MNTLDIELRQIDTIKPYESNPRINDDAVDAVAASLKEFGFRQPIVVDADGVIIVGHTRWKAARKLGLANVPVHVATDLSPEQIKAYRIADNQTATLAEWDFDLLPIELKDLQGADYDLSLLGFGDKELAQLLDGEAAGGLTDPDDVPEPPDDPITQPGDLWILGAHRLLCGDSGSVADHSTHPAHTFDGARQYAEGYPGFDMISNVSHDAHSSHGSHSAHSAHSAHDTVSNKPEYKTVVIIERVD